MMTDSDFATFFVFFLAIQWSAPDNYLHAFLLALGSLSGHPGSVPTWHLQEPRLVGYKRKKTIAASDGQVFRVQ